MKIIDIVAILGALAWLPQIIHWVYLWWQKPKLKIFHDVIPEIGYTRFGNTFNLRMSFLSRNKQALIDKIELHLIDKDNAEFILDWNWYSETFYELQAPGGTATMAKRQNAIAINAFKDVLIEKFIGFQSSDFLFESRRLTHQLNTIVENHRDAAGQIDIEAIKQTEAYNNMIRLYENSMIWKLGKYKAWYKIHIAETNQEIKGNFTFSFNDLEISRLRQNLDIIKKNIDIEFFQPVETAREQYIWVSPNIQ